MIGSYERADFFKGFHKSICTYTPIVSLTPNILSNYIVEIIVLFLHTYIGLTKTQRQSTAVNGSQRQSTAVNSSQKFVSPFFKSQ